MNKGRLEAFSDGVIAIIITIMVLELKVPHDSDLASLRPLLPVVLSYLLSYVFIGIYWNNHHHLLHAAKSVTASIMWANLHLLFWLSLIPFVTAWWGERQGTWPTAFYGIVLFMAAVAYTILQRLIVTHHGKDSVLASAVGTDLKGKISVASYALAIGLSFVNQWVAMALYVFVALIWLIPDRRIESALK